MVAAEADAVDWAPRVLFADPLALLMGSLSNPHNHPHMRPLAFVAFLLHFWQTALSAMHGVASAASDAGVDRLPCVSL